MVEATWSSQHFVGKLGERKGRQVYEVAWRGMAWDHKAL